VNLPLCLDLIPVVDLKTDDRHLIQESDRCVALMDLVHDHMDPAHAFYNRKINLEFLENLEALYFCINTPLFYFIYVLVPAILQKHP
jgi:hypothetical protein